MAIAYVKDSGELFADNASSIAPSLASVVAGNNVVLMVCGVANSQSDYSAPSGWSDAISPAGATGSSWNATSAIFYKENSAGGTESGTVTLVGGSYAAATICEISGVLTSASLDTTDSSVVSTQTDTTGNTGSGVTNSQANSIVFAALSASGGGGSTADLARSTSGYTTIYSEAAEATHTAYSFDYQIVSSSASRSVSYSWTSGSNHAGVLAIFKEGGTAPAFTVQPENQSAAVGGTVTFNCTTTGATSYQWQSAPITSLYSRTPGTWSDIGSATTEDYTTGTLSDSDNGKWYRLKATNASGNTYSRPVRLWIRNLAVTGKGRPLESAWAHCTEGAGGLQMLRTVLAPENKANSASSQVFNDWWWAATGGGGNTNLVIQDAGHAHTADGVVLVTTRLLTVQDSTHAQLADNVVLNIASDVALTIAEASHAHTVDAITLVTQALLAIQEAVHLHSAESPTLSTAAVLSVQDATHAQTTDAVTLVTQALLAIAEAFHAHAADNITLSTAGTINLLVNDAGHAHTAESLILSLASYLAIQDSTHAHTVDAVVLTTAVLLAIADSSHSHFADNLTLSVSGAASLVIQDSTHAQTAENVVLYGMVVWPYEWDVRLGVTYGPTGVEFTGTYAGGSGFISIINE